MESTPNPKNQLFLIYIYGSGALQASTALAVAPHRTEGEEGGEEREEERGGGRVGGVGEGLWSLPR